MKWSENLVLYKTGLRPIKYGLCKL